jgi:hypothetical protein
VVCWVIAVVYGVRLYFINIDGFTYADFICASNLALLPKAVLVF